MQCKAYTKDSASYLEHFMEDNGGDIQIMHVLQLLYRLTLHVFCLKKLHGWCKCMSQNLRNDWLRYATSGNTQEKLDNK